MNVEAICPLCYASHIVPDEMRGRKYRCEECEEVFVVNRKSKTTSKRPKIRTVEAAEDEGRTPEGRGSKGAPVEVTPVEAAEVLPAAIQTDDRKLRTKGATQQRPDDREEEEKGRSKGRRSADRDEDEEDDGKPRARPVRRSGQLPIGCMIGGVVGAIAILALLGLGAWWLLRPSKPPVAENQTPNNPSKVDKTKDDPPKPRNDQPKEDKPKPKPVPPKEDPPIANPPKPAVWNVKVDPAAAFKLDHAGKQEIKPSGTLPSLLFPTTPSPYVLIGGPGAGNELQVIDLRTLRVSGKLVAAVPSAHLPPVLSPDGAHVAAVEPTKLGTVNVWTVATGQMKELEVHPKPVSLDVLDFAGPGKLVTCKPGELGKKLFEVWDVATGKAERSFERPEPFDREAVTLSPGYTYLAVGSPEGVWVYNLKTGEQAGQLAWPAPEKNRGLRLRALSFSPDGAELAALLMTGGAVRSRVISWDVARGEAVVDHGPSGEMRMAGGSPQLARGPAIDWLADRRGWVFFGQVAIDHDSGKSLGTLTASPPGRSSGPRRLVGPDHLVMLSGTLGGQVLAVERIDWAKLKPGGR